MYEVFRLREEEESSANRDAEGKKPMTREKLRNIFISGVHVLPGLLPRLVACISFPNSSFSIFSPLFFIRARNADTRHPPFPPSVILFIRVANSRGTFCADYSHLFKSKQRRPRDDVFARAQRKTKYLAK